MILFEKKAAIKAFYYLMAVDGAIATDEVACFDEIGNELDPVDFPKYRDEIIDECEKQMKTIIDDEDYYEVILEGVDKALSAQIGESENGVSVRFLIWNLLVIAFSNKNYSSFERKLIKHIVRVWNMDRTVFLEMEQIIKTHADIMAELEYTNQSNRPYSEVRPIVDELERRQKVVLNCAKQLIEDELYIPVEKSALPGNGLYVGAAHTMNKFGSAMVQTTSTIGKKTAEMTRSLGKQTKGLFGGRKSAKNEPDAVATEITEVNSEE
jgi:hypothetical protein